MKNKLKTTYKKKQSTNKTKNIIIKINKNKKLIKKQKIIRKGKIRKRTNKKSINQKKIKNNKKTNKINNQIRIHKAPIMIMIQ